MLVESVSPHPLAEQAQACGRLTQADGPEGPTAPVVTTGSTQKLDHISRFAPVHAILLCINKKFWNCTCHPCARAGLILSVSYVALQSTVYSLLDKMVIDKLNEAAIELTSAVGPAKDWFSNLFL